MTPKTYRALAILFSAWLLLCVVVSWPAMQDDAFIHLRYAANLLQYHLISYDGTHPDYGTSSLLYVVLLASLREFVRSPVLPRAVSSFFHLVLFGGLVWSFPRALKSAPRLAWSFAVLLLATLVTPMAIRWLDDGMETSLTLCLIALLAFATSRLCHSRNISNRSAIWLFALGLIATLTRVEFLLLFGVASVTLFLARRSLRKAEARASTPSDRLRLACRSAAPLLGSLVAALIIRITMHALIPDTAIAKTDGIGGWYGTLHAILSVLVSSLSFGMLLALFWALTLVALLAYKRRIPLAVIAANSLFPVTVALATLRGQQVQGIRYFAWTLLFPILWNTLELRFTSPAPAPSTERSFRLATVALAAALILLLPVESWLLYGLFRARSRSLAEFRAQHLDRLSDMQFVAFDVGYIGYFTNAPLCDMAGLVNGRVRASMTFHQRVTQCVAEHPQVAFVSQFSLADLNDSLDLSDWSICSTYDFANLRASDLHYLIASPSATPAVCAAAGNSPKPIGPLLHPPTKP
jgi:hypothetical protein